MVELLSGAALIAYGEASVAYVGETRRPGLAGRAALWGIRIGWLLQTVLLAVQAHRSDGFPWSSPGGALNLLAWLVVTVYLAWACQPRYRLLGLTVAPGAVLLLALAIAADGLATRADDAGPLLAAHVLAMLAAFSALAIASAFSIAYLWHAHRLKRRAARVLRLRLPSLETLDALAGVTATAAFMGLTIGVVLGAAAFALRGGSADAAMAATLVVWLLVLLHVVHRRRGRLHGRRAARSWLVVSAAAAAVLPVVHYA